MNINKINPYLILIFIFIPLLFISDAITKYYFVTGGHLIRISLLVRLLFELFILIYLIKNINKSILIYLSFILILFISFLLGQMSIGNENNIVENFIRFNKYIYMFLIFLFFQKILTIKKIQQEKIYKLLSIIFIINIFFIFIGFFLELNFFKSFPHMDYRFGYDGVVLAGNEASYVLISMIAFFYFRAFYEDKNKFLLIIAIAASILSGTKAVYLFLILLSFFHIIYKLRKIKLLLLIPFFIYISGYIYNYFMSNEFQELIAFYMRTLDEKGLWYMMLSGRNIILENESILVMKGWGLINYLIGGVNASKYIMEMDLFDLLFFFGGLGSVIYIYLFYKSFIQKSLKNRFNKFFIFSIIGLAFFGGHFLTSPTSALYFSLVIIYFQTYRMRQNAKNIIN